VDDRAISDVAVQNSVPDVVPQYRDCGRIQHGRLGFTRGAGRLRAGAAQVHRCQCADHGAAGHLPAARLAVVHPTVSHSDQPGDHQYPRRADRHLPNLPDAVCNLGDVGLLSLDPRGSGRCCDDRWVNPAGRVLADHLAAGRSCAALGDAGRVRTRRRRACRVSRCGARLDRLVRALENAREVFGL